jgi:hypothetical protein
LRGTRDTLPAAAVATITVGTRDIRQSSIEAKAQSRNDPLIEHCAMIGALAPRLLTIKTDGLKPAGTTCSVATLAI